MGMFTTLEKRAMPRETIHRFIGGLLDGQEHKATEHYVLTDKVIVTVNDDNYQYIGNDTFEFIGMTHRAVFQPPTFKQRFLNWLLK